MHAQADVQTRARMEPIIFGKSVAFRTSVRRGNSSPEERERVAEKLKAYEHSVKTI
jgi:hypothetical protein